MPMFSHSNLCAQYTVVKAQPKKFIANGNVAISRPPPGPGLSNCTIMNMQSETVPSGAVPWAWGCWSMFQDTSASSWLPNIQIVPDNFAHCTAHHPNLDCLIQSSVWHAEFQGEECSGWAMPAILCLATKQISFRTLCHYPTCTSDKTGPTGICCLARMPSFRAGNALSGPGQPNVDLTKSRQP
eukprot:660095-Pelagomonas_calceolata.AAC.2